MEGIQAELVRLASFARVMAHLSSGRDKGTLMTTESTAIQNELDLSMAVHPTPLRPAQSFNHPLDREAIACIRPLNSGC